MCIFNSVFDPVQTLPDKHNSQITYNLYKKTAQKKFTVLHRVACNL